MADSTGPMMNMLRNSARPASTWLGGTLDRPSALRVMLSTTNTLVKLVQSRSSAGATDSTVIAMMMVIVLLGLPPLTVTFTVPEESLAPFGPTGGTGAGGATGSLTGTAAT